MGRRRRRRRRNTEMKKFIVLSSLLLGCFLVVTVQGDSSARVVPAAAGEDMIVHEKEPFERTGAAHHMRKLGFGTTHHEDENGAEDGSGGASKISGYKEHIDGLKKSFGSLQAQKNDHQKHMIMGRKAYLKFSKFVIPRNSPTNTKTKCTSQDCDVAVPVKGSLERSPRSDEQPQGTAEIKDATQQSLVDAARDREIENLIYKDYKGRPTHKPPINNHEPSN